MKSRLIKSIFGVLLAFGLFANGITPVKAAYTYTVTISSGLNGTFGDGTTEKTATYSYSEKSSTRINLSALRDGINAKLEQENSKYYCKGFHLNGTDKYVGDETITSDVFYVATYGLKATMVPYTVRYLLADGSPVPGSTPDVYYGTIGEKPVVAFKYFEGYIPTNAFNITGTLKESGNEFIFYYTPLGGGAVGPGAETVIVIDDGGVITYVTVPGGGGGGGAAPAGGGAAPGGGAVPAGGGAGPAVIPDDTTPAAGPAEIIDIDEPETPQGNFSPEPTSTSETIPEPGTPGGGLSNAWKIALATGGGIALLLLLLLLLRRKDQNE